MILMDDLHKVIIVEGRSDKKRIAPIIKEPIEIICTNGTINSERLEQIIEENELEERDVYILADADDSGEKLRRQFVRELPHAEHIFIDKMYREVATAPDHHLAKLLLAVNIDVKQEFIKK
jgi:toprim domain protein